MGWLIPVVYFAIGVWSARFVIRWVAEEYPRIDLGGEDLALVVTCVFIWPILVPMFFCAFGQFPKFNTPNIDTRLRKFAGLPPRKGH